MIYKFGYSSLQPSEIIAEQLLEADGDYRDICGGLDDIMVMFICAGMTQLSMGNVIELFVD